MTRERLCSSSCRRGATRGPYSFDQCRSCWRLINDPKIMQAHIPLNLPCIHRGEYLEETVACKPCRGARLKLYECDVYGKCTIGKKVNEIACCKNCPSFQDVDLKKSSVRNLIYHILPVLDNDAWKRNISNLLKRIDLFNGRRIVAVAQGSIGKQHYGRTSYSNLASLDQVKREFRDQIDQFLVIDNVPTLCEVVSFPLLLEQVKSVHPNHVTFFGHSKGVVRPKTSIVHHWTDTLYELNLDYPDLVLDQLAKYSMVGSFKKNVKAFEGSRSTWHYSCTFFWFRNRDLFSKPNYSQIDQQWWGVESWPGCMFSRPESVCLFHEGRQYNLYNSPYWRNVVDPALIQWKKEKSSLQV